MLHRPAAGATVIGVSVLAAALLTKFGSEINLVMIQLVLPTLWGATTALCWPKGAWWRRVIGLAAVVVLYQLLRAVVYGVQVGWVYVIDVVGRYLMLYSTAAQLLVSVMALICINAMLGRLRGNHAA